MTTSVFNADVPEMLTVFKYSIGTEHFSLWILLFNFDNKLLLYIILYKRGGMFCIKQLQVALVP